jgi:hypothetical protein
MFNNLRDTDICPGDGVVPPSFKLSHNSTRNAPPVWAAKADLIELAQTSREIIVKQDSR